MVITVKGLGSEPSATVTNNAAVFVCSYAILQLNNVAIVGSGVTL